jgi:hypothetical protein
MQHTPICTRSQNCKTPLQVCVLALVRACAVLTDLVPRRVCCLASRKLLATCTGTMKYVEAHIVNNYARYVPAPPNSGSPLCSDCRVGLPRAFVCSVYPFSFRSLGSGTSADTLSLVNIASTDYINTQFGTKCIDVKLKGQMTFSGTSDPSAITIRMCNTADSGANSCSSNIGCWLNLPTSTYGCAAPNLLSTSGTVGVCVYLRWN